MKDPATLVSALKAAFLVADCNESPKPLTLTVCLSFLDGDIKSLTDQIQKNIDLGLELSTAIIAFEKDRKHNNFFFASNNL